MTCKKICKVNDFLKIKHGMTHKNIACYSKKKKKPIIYYLLFNDLLKMEGK